MRQSPGRHVFGRLLPVALMLLAGVVATPAAAGEGGPVGEGDAVGIGLLEAPTSRADDPRALVYVIDHLQPGDIVERRIEVTNTAAAPIDVSLYPAAATIGETGWTPLDGRTANALTGWTTVSPSGATVPAGGNAPATIRIAVPDDAQAGEHYGVVWAELPVRSGQTVDVVNRVGIRMYLSVGDGTEPVSDFVIRAVHATTQPDGTRSLDVDVDNVGGRAVDVSGEVTLTDGPGGSTAGPFRSPTGPAIAPGGSGVVSLGVPADLPEGTWTADLTLRSGVLERRASVPISWSDSGASTVEIDDGDRATADGIAADAESSGDRGMLGAGLLALALILAVGVTGTRILRRQRGGRKAHPPS